MQQTDFHEGATAGPFTTAEDTLIDCQTCPVRGLRCDDCVVAVLAGPMPILLPNEAAAVDLLSRRGLLAPIRDPRVSDLPNREKLGA